jgi:hypothetical protein
MHRTDRFFFRPFSRWFPATLLHFKRAWRGDARPALALCLTAAALSAGCTLITDVDRSKIPAPEVIPPPATPPDEGDGGTPPATESDAGDGGAEPGDAAAGDSAPSDAAVDDAG